MKKTFYFLTVLILSGIFFVSFVSAKPLFLFALNNDTGSKQIDVAASVINYTETVTNSNSNSMEIKVAASVKGTIFPDVSDGHKNINAVKYLKENGVIQGYPDGTFKPNQTINRAELLKIYIEGQNITPDENTYKNCFPDVKDDWYAKYVCYAKEQTWVEGYPDGTFKPAQTVNKVEAIKMLVESFGYGKDLPETISEIPFIGMDPNIWYAKYITFAKEKNLLEEVTDYEYDAKMARAGISENLARLMLIKEKNTDAFEDSFYEKDDTL